MAYFCRTWCLRWKRWISLTFYWLLRIKIGIRWFTLRRSLIIIGRRNWRRRRRRNWRNNLCRSYGWSNRTSWSGLTIKLGTQWPRKLRTIICYRTYYASPWSYLIRIWWIFIWTLSYWWRHPYSWTFIQRRSSWRIRSSCWRRLCLSF